MNRCGREEPGRERKKRAEEGSCLAKAVCLWSIVMLSHIQPLLRDCGGLGRISPFFSSPQLTALIVLIYERNLHFAGTFYNLLDLYLRSSK